MDPQAQLHKDIRAGLEAFAKLPLQQRLERLRDIGILNADLELSERYGGAPSAGRVVRREAEDEPSRNYHVVPHAKGWAVMRVGASRATSVHATRAEAGAAARQRAARAGGVLVPTSKAGTASTSSARASRGKGAAKG